MVSIYGTYEYIPQYNYIAPAGQSKKNASAEVGPSKKRGTAGAAFISRATTEQDTPSDESAPVTEAPIYTTPAAVETDNTCAHSTAPVGASKTSGGKPKGSEYH